MQPDCDLLPIKGMFVSQLNPFCVLFHPASLCSSGNRCFCPFPDKCVAFRLTWFVGQAWGNSDTRRRRRVAAPLSWAASAATPGRDFSCYRWEVPILLHLGVAASLCAKRTTQISNPQPRAKTRLFLPSAPPTQPNHQWTLARCCLMDIQICTFSVFNLK